MTKDEINEELIKLYEEKVEALEELVDILKKKLALYEPKDEEPTKL